MKTKLLIGIILLSFSAAEGQQNALLPEQLIVNYPVLFSEYKNDNYWHRNSRVCENNQKSETFIGIQLTKKALNGDIQAFTPITYTGYLSRFRQEVFETFDREKILRRLGYEKDTIFLDTQPNAAEIRKTDYSEIRSLFFTEAWSFDKEAFHFEKTVLAAGPVREFRINQAANSASKRIVFMSLQAREPGFFKKRFSEKRMQLINEIAYECLLTDPEQAFFESNYLEVRQAPFFTSRSHENLMQEITERVLSGRTEAYSYPGGELMSLSAAEKALGITVDTIFAENSETGETQILTAERALDIRELKSIIFFEKWYFDPKTARIKKTVEAVAPVRHFYADLDYDREKPLKKVVFKVFLN